MFAREVPYPFPNGHKLGAVQGERFGHSWAKAVFCCGRNVADWRLDVSICMNGGPATLRMRPGASNLVSVVIRSLIVFLVFVWPAALQAAEPAGETRVMVQPSDAVRPYLLFDVDSGQVLAHENAFRRWAPASLTKLMTVYATFRALKLQQIDLNSPVRVSENALLKPPTKMGFPIGTILTVDTAVKILMVKSANDISVALAEAVAGSEPDFIDLMNAHARRLGMTDSHFVNPHGLHEPDQYSTARDFALLAAALTLEFPEYADRFKIPALRHGKRRLRNQ